MEMLIKENAQRIYTERSVVKDTKRILYITDFKKNNDTKEKAEVVGATPASSNNAYSWLNNAIDYDNDPIGSFFMNATTKR